MSSFHWFKFYFYIQSERPLKSKQQFGPLIHFKIQVEDASKTLPSANSLQDREMKFVFARFVKKINSCSSATNERAVLFGQRFIIEFETQQHWTTGQIRNLFSGSVWSHFSPNVGCPWQMGQTTFKLKENHSNRISTNLIMVPSKSGKKNWFFL